MAAQTSDNYEDMDIEELRARLAEAEETLRAIRSGEVDALVVAGPQGNQIYTLKGAESTYRVLVEAMNEGALVLTSDGSIMYSNGTFADMVDVPLEQVIGSRIHRFVRDTDLAIVDELLKAGSRTDTKREINLKNEPGNETVPALVSVGKLPVDDEEGISAVVTDLTEHKRTEAELHRYREHLEELVEERTEQLRIALEKLESSNGKLLHEIEARKRVEKSLLRSRERLRMVLDSITDGYYLLDSKWRFVEVNPVAERHFGRSAGELKGKVVWDVAPTPRESIVFKEFHLALLENHPVDFEAESGLHPDQWYELHLYPRDGMLEVYYRDITERKLAEKSLATAKDLLQHQVYLLQRALIPDKPEAIEGYSTASAYIPAYAGTEIGGDFLDVFRTEDGKVGILIGDVSGKGIESASLAASTRSTIRAFAYDSSSPSHALFHANSLLATQHIENMQFVTAFLAVLDPATGCVRYSSAGHPPAIICREGGTDILYVSSMPLGILDRVQYDEGLYTLSPGDSMVLYTDGITEARHDHVLFGTEGIENILSAYGSAPPDELVEEILSAVKDWAHGNLRDDTAMLILRREE